MMNAINPERSENFADAAEAAADFEGELREIIRGRDVTFLRAPMAKPMGDANNLNSLIQRVAGSSTAEIDHLIRELQEMREFLETEGERVQREIAGYARVSQEARTQMETLGSRIAEWRAAMQAPSALTHD
jgi:hypothetical protein